MKKYTAAKDGIKILSILWSVKPTKNWTEAEQYWKSKSNRTNGTIRPKLCVSPNRTNGTICPNCVFHPIEPMEPYAPTVSFTNRTNGTICPNCVFLSTEPSVPTASPNMYNQWNRI